MGKISVIIPVYNIEKKDNFLRKVSGKDKKTSCIKCFEI